MRCKSLFYLLPLFATAACKDNNDNLRLQIISDGLSRSNEMIKAHTELVYHSLYDKLKDPVSHAKASIWQPKAMEIHQLSEDVIAYIDLLKNELKNNAGLFEKQQKCDELSKKLIQFKENVIAVLDNEFKKDTLSYSFFRKSLLSLQNTIPIYKATSAEPIDHKFPLMKADQLDIYLKGANVGEAIAILNKLENDVIFTENITVDLLNNWSTGHTCGFEVFSAIATQNARYLKKGDFLEIHAGVGNFTVSCKPQITINGRLTDITAEGIAEYRMQVNKQPGKYFIPLRIEFTKPDGSKSAMSKKIEYEVAE